MRTPIVIFLLYEYGSRRAAAQVAEKKRRELELVQSARQAREMLEQAEDETDAPPKWMDGLNGASIHKASFLKESY